MSPVRSFQLRWFLQFFLKEPHFRVFLMDWRAFLWTFLGLPVFKRRFLDKLNHVFVTSISVTWDHCDIKWGSAFWSPRPYQNSSRFQNSIHKSFKSVCRRHCVSNTESSINTSKVFRLQLKIMLLHFLGIYHEPKREPNPAARGTLYKDPSHAYNNATVQLV